MAPKLPRKPLYPNKTRTPHPLGTNSTKAPARHNGPPLARRATRLIPGRTLSGRRDTIE